MSRKKTVTPTTETPTETVPTVEAAPPKPARHRRNSQELRRMRISANLLQAQRDGAQALGRKAYVTPCACKTAMLALPLPEAHCPHCHKTWTSRSAQGPTRCPMCRYDLQRWRLRMGIQLLDAGMVMPAPQPLDSAQQRLLETLTV